MACRVVRPSRDRRNQDARAEDLGSHRRHRPEVHRALGRDGLSRRRGDRPPFPVPGSGSEADPAEGRRFRRALEVSVEQEWAGQQPNSQKTIGQGPVPARAWFYFDNGFSSRVAMDDLHRPIVAAAQQILKATSGNVLDLGCGNGALLAKIIATGASLVPYGVDNRRSSLTHVAEVLPSFSANFLNGDLFDYGVWAKDRRYTLAILMAGRLVEVGRPRAERLLSALKNPRRRCCSTATLTPGIWHFAVVAEFGLRLHLYGDADAMVGSMTSNNDKGARPTDPGGCAGA